MLINSILIAPDMTSTSGIDWLLVGYMAGILIAVAAVIAIIAGSWKVFEKAKWPGWAAIIPVYNNYVLVRIARLSLWYLVLQFSPLLVPLTVFLVPALTLYVSMVSAILSIGVSFYIMMEIAARFDKGNLFALGLVLLPFVFIPILGFGSSTYDAA